MLTLSENTLVIKSDIRELEKVENFLSDIFDEYMLERVHFNKVLLCVSEAVINSIEHGNKNDCEKCVTIEADCELNQLDVTIKDEGKGFSLSKIENPTLDKNIKKESGRGIHIIRSLSDSLKYNGRGNTLQLKIDCR